MATDPPWPVVGECHYPAPSLVRQNHTCPQCDGSHDHEWVAWRDAPGIRPDLGEEGERSRVVGKESGPGVPVRCRTCGGRKCDVNDCRARRHHAGPHDPF